MGFSRDTSGGEILDTMNLDEYLLENREASFIMRASSDSMKDAGIMRGDMVIVERGREPRAGDIVVADTGGEYVMRYYDDLPREELRILAVVRGVVRKY